MESVSEFFQSLFGPVTDLLGPFGLRLAAALAILIFGWLIAVIISRLVRRVVAKTGLGDRIVAWMGKEDAADAIHADRQAGRLTFWLIMIFVLIAALRMLGLTFVTDPFYDLLVQILGFIPRVLGALILFLMAWAIGATVRMLVFQTAKAAGLDRRLRSDADATGSPMAKAIGDIFFYLILLFFLPGVLDALALQGLLEPVQAMVTTILGSLPHLLGAGIIIAVSFFVGRLVGSLITTLLSTIGFNNLLEHLGVKASPEASRSPSDIAGLVVFAGILLFGATEASRVAGFETIADMFSKFSVLAGNIVLAVIIFGLGLYLANLAYKAIGGGGTKQANRLALVVRAAILALVGAMALSQTGIGNEIIALAFGLTLGAIAVAAAIAFGLGGREAAADQIARWKKANEN